jgi:hypothetical protein
VVCDLQLPKLFLRLQKRCTQAVFDALLVHNGTHLHTTTARP